MMRLTPSCGADKEILFVMFKRMKKKEKRKLSTHDECPQGHKFTKDNTYVYPGHSSGQTLRMCKTCAKARSAKRYEERGDEIRRRALKRYYKLKGARI